MKFPFEVSADSTPCCQGVLPCCPAIPRLSAFAMPTSQCTHRSLGFVAGISLLATYAVIGPSRAISPDVYMPSDFAVDTAKCLKSLVPAVQTTYNSIMEPVDVSVEDVSFVQGLIAKQSCRKGQRRRAERMGSL